MKKNESSIIFSIFIHNKNILFDLSQQLPDGFFDEFRSGTITLLLPLHHIIDLSDQFVWNSDRGERLSTHDTTFLSRIT